MTIGTYDYLYLGGAPADEDCKQVGIDDPIEQKKEAARFGIALDRFYKEKLDRFPGDIYLSLKRESHDFGDYWDVIVQYNVENEGARQLAIEIEENCPLTWAELEGGK